MVHITSRRSYVGERQVFTQRNRMPYFENVVCCRGQVAKGAGLVFLRALAREARVLSLAKALKGVKRRTNRNSVADSTLQFGIYLHTMSLPCTILAQSTLSNRQADNGRSMFIYTCRLKVTFIDKNQQQNSCRKYGLIAYS